MGNPYRSKLSGSLFTRLPEALAISDADAEPPPTHDDTSLLFPSKWCDWDDMTGPATTAGEAQRAAASAAAEAADAMEAMGLASSLARAARGATCCRVGVVVVGAKADTTDEPRRRAEAALRRRRMVFGS